MKFKILFLFLFSILDQHSTKAQFDFNFNGSIFPNTKIIAGGAAVFFALTSDEVGLDVSYFPSVPQNNSAIPNFSFRKNFKGGAIELGLVQYKEEEEESFGQSIQAVLLYNPLELFHVKKTKLELGVAVNSKFKAMLVSGISYQYSKHWSFSTRIYYINGVVLDDYKYKMAPNIQAGIRFSFSEGKSVFKLMSEHQKKIKGEH